MDKTGAAARAKSSDGASNVNYKQQPESPTKPREQKMAFANEFAQQFNEAKARLDNRKSVSIIEEENRVTPPFNERQEQSSEIEPTSSNLYTINLNTNRQSDQCDNNYNPLRTAYDVNNSVMTNDGKTSEQDRIEFKLNEMGKQLGIEKPQDVDDLIDFYRTSRNTFKALTDQIELLQLEKEERENDKRLLYREYNNYRRGQANEMEKLRDKFTEAFEKLKEEFLNREPSLDYENEEFDTAGINQLNSTQIESKQAAPHQTPIAPEELRKNDKRHVNFQNERERQSPKS